MAGPTAASLLRQRWSVLTLLSASLLLVSVDATVLLMALPALSADLSVSASGQLWVLSIYSLVAAPLLLAFGTLGDYFGRRRVLVAGYVVFGLASLGAAASVSVPMLIAARVALGVGGAMIMPATLAILRQAFPDRAERRTAIGVWSGVAGSGAVLGPLLGGFLVQAFSWRAAFVINVPVMAAVLPMTYRLVPESADPPEGRWDAVSAVLAVFGVLGVAFAIKQAALVGSYFLLGPLAGAGGLVLLVAFVRRQRHIRPPLLDLALFRKPAFTVAVGSVLLVMISLVGLGLLFAQYLQLVLQLNPVAAAVRLLSVMGAAVVGSLVAPPLLRRLDNRAVTVGGFTVSGTALVPAAFWLDRTENLWLMAPVLVAVGLGVSVALTAASDALLATAPASQAGAASAVEETAYELGAGLGITVLGTVSTGIYAAIVTVPDSLVGPMRTAAREGLTQAAAVAAALPAPVGQELLAQAQESFVVAMRASLVVSSVLLLVTAVAAARFLAGPERAVVAGGAVQSVRGGWRTPALFYGLISNRVLRAGLGWDWAPRDVRWVRPSGPTTCVDVGCGGAFYTAALAARLGGASTLVLLDPAESALARLTPAAPPGGARLARLAADGCRLPIADDSVDVLFYGYSLEEMPDPVAAVREAHRVLRPGGQLVVFIWRPLMPRGRRRPVTDCMLALFEMQAARRNLQNIRLRLVKPAEQPPGPVPAERTSADASS